MKPGNLVCSYRRSIRIVPIDYQNKRRDVCTAAKRRRSDIAVAATSWWWRGEFFRWEGEPQRKSSKMTITNVYTTITYVCTSKLRLESQRLYPAFPLPPSRTAYNYIQHLHGTATERIRPGKSIISLLFPTLPNSLDLPRGIPSSSIPLARGIHRGPRLGP